MLRAKNPATWSIVTGGGEGTLRYHETTGSFTFRGRRLAPDTEYVLARQAGAPPSGQRLASGRTSPDGELHLTGTWHHWTGKFWLVLSSDVVELPGSGSEQAARLAAWHPAHYLFEERVLGRSGGGGP